MTAGHTIFMGVAKVTISIEEQLLTRVDRLVRSRRFANRSQAIQEAIEDKLRRLNRTRLAEECSKLDPSLERSLAEEGVKLDLEEWPEY